MMGRRCCLRIWQGVFSSGRLGENVTVLVVLGVGGMRAKRTAHMRD